MQSVSVQALDNDLQAPDGKQFSLFSVLNTPSDAQGTTAFTVNVAANSLGTTGLHRICTQALSRSGQPVLMAVAQRGAQDDCVRITVT